MISELLSGLIGGFGIERLMKMVRPRKESEFDSMSSDELAARNGWIERGSKIISLATFLLLSAVFLVVGLDGDIWKIAFWLGFPFTLALAFVCSMTLPTGSKRFRELLRFHELKSRVHATLILLFDIPFAIAGLIAAIKLTVETIV